MASISNNEAALKAFLESGATFPLSLGADELDTGNLFGHGTNIRPSCLILDTTRVAFGFRSNRDLGWHVGQWLWLASQPAGWHEAGRIYGDKAANFSRIARACFTKLGRLDVADALEESLRATVALWILRTTRHRPVGWMGERRASDGREWDRTPGPVAIEHFYPGLSNPGEIIAGPRAADRSDDDDNVVKWHYIDAALDRAPSKVPCMAFEMAGVTGVRPFAWTVPTATRFGPEAANWLRSEADREACKRAYAGDTKALATLVGWLRAHPPHDWEVIEHREGGSMSYFPDLPSGSTAGVNSKVVLAAKNQHGVHPAWTLIANTGDRKTNEAPWKCFRSRTWIDESAEGRFVVAQIDDERAEGSWARGPVRCPAPTGRMHSRFEIKDGAVEAEFSDGAVVVVPGPPEPLPADDEQPEVPPMPTTIRCADWLAPAHLMGGCAGPGYYCAVLPTQDPRTFVLVKQNAPYHPGAAAHPLGHGWGIEGLIVKPDGSVCISYEATFGPDGALRHERCFYDDKLWPGYPWLPATLPGSGATPQRTLSGWTVERHVSDGPGWRFPVGSVPMRPGETRTNKAVARCVFEHLGARVVGGVPVAVISRYDRLGQEPRVNQEWYEFGATAEGALGYLSHRGIEYPDVDANDVRADRMEKFAHSVCVRMMGPDGKIRWYATPNYQGAVPPGVEDAPLPVVPRSERRSWWEKLIEFFKNLGG